MAVTIEQIKELREKTGAGVNAVKEALEFSKGDNDKAIAYLREKGLAKSAKRAGNQAENGVIGVYVHPDNRLTVMVEVASETDFAARGEQMKKFATDIAVHIAANNPEYVNVEAVPAKVLEDEKAVFAKEVEGKPESIAEKILNGKLEKFYADAVLTHQKLFSDESKTVQDYLNELVAQVGEKIEITRFVKFQIAKPTVSSNL